MFRKPGEFFWNFIQLSKDLSIGVCSVCKVYTDENEGPFQRSWICDIAAIVGCSSFTCVIVYPDQNVLCTVFSNS